MLFAPIRGEPTAASRREDGLTEAFDDLEHTIQVIPR